MFPFHEVKIKWDDYGEIIRPEDWIDPSSDIKTDINRVMDNTGGSSNYEDIAAPNNGSGDPIEIPTKCIKTPKRLQIKAKVHYIDFEGRSDGESIHRCLTQMKPRRVIIVRGSVEDGNALAEFCIPLSAQVANDDRGSIQNAAQGVQRVFTPRNGEKVDATTESYIYQVRLPDSLMSGIVFQNGKDDTQLTWVDGCISKQKHKDAKVELDSTEQQLNHDLDNLPATIAEEEETPAIPSLEPIKDEELLGHPSSFINELKLSDFKIVLSKNNIQSEFQGGVLFCGANNMVALRRHDSGHVTIEGCVCDDYYLVRSLLYERYAII